MKKILLNCFWCSNLYVLVMNVPFSCISYVFLFSFSEFIEGVSQFSVKGDKESKLRCKSYFPTTLLNEIKNFKELLQIAILLLSKPNRLFWCNLPD